MTAQASLQGLTQGGGGCPQFVVVLTRGDFYVNFSDFFKSNFWVPWIIFFFVFTEGRFFWSLLGFFSEPYISPLVCQLFLFESQFKLCLGKLKHLGELLTPER